MTKYGYGDDLPLADFMAFIARIHEYEVLGYEGIHTDDPDSHIDDYSRIDDPQGNPIPETVTYGSDALQSWALLFRLHDRKE